MACEDTLGSMMFRAWFRGWGVGGIAMTALCYSLALSVLGCSQSDDGDDPEDAGAGGMTAGASAGAAGTGAGATGGNSGGDGGASAGSGGTSAGAAGTTAGSAGTSAGSGGSGGGEAGSGGGEPEPGSCEVGGIYYEDGASNIPAEDGCNTCSCGAGALACTRIACPPIEERSECAVVRRYDQCCAPWEAVTRAELEANPCLVEQGARMPAAGAFPEGCAAPNCTAVLCAEPPSVPPSRVATPNGVNGACLFSDECHAEASCVLASDMRQCCACPVSMPEILVDSEPCLAREGEAALGCTEFCDSDIACGQCPPPTDPVCNVRDSWSLCQ